MANKLFRIGMRDANDITIKYRSTTYHFVEVHESSHARLLVTEKEPIHMVATCWMGHRVAAWQKRVPENGQLITNYGAMYINKYHFLNNPPYL